VSARLLRFAGLFGLYVAVVAVDGACARLEDRERELAQLRADVEDLDDGLEAFDATDVLTAHDLAGVA
jgi:hypothetical protein